MRERRLLPCAGVYNFLLHIFTSLKRKRRFFLAEANTTFIAYLYKPEAQAKVLQIPVYYSHIIPSLALQACKTRDTLRVGFHIRRSLWTKERGPFGKLRDRGSFGTVSELVELADISCVRVKDTAWILNAKDGTPHTRS